MDSDEAANETSPLLGDDLSSAANNGSRTAVLLDGGHTHSIPPPDHGKAAWLFLAGCFIIEGLVWGKVLPHRL